MSNGIDYSAVWSGGWKPQLKTGGKLYEWTKGTVQKKTKKWEKRKNQVMNVWQKNFGGPIGEEQLEWLKNQYVKGGSEVSIQSMIASLRNQPLITAEQIEQMTGTPTVDDVDDIDDADGVDTEPSAWERLSEAGILDPLKKDYGEMTEDYTKKQMEALEPTIALREKKAMTRARELAESHGRYFSPHLVRAEQSVMETYTRIRAEEEVKHREKGLGVAERDKNRAVSAALTAEGIDKSFITNARNLDIRESEIELKGLVGEREYDLLMERAVAEGKESVVDWILSAAEMVFTKA